MFPARGWRIITFGITAALCTMLLSVLAAHAYHDPSGVRSASPYDNVIVISIADYHSPAFDIIPLVEEDRVYPSLPAFQPVAIKERASRSAVRPTAVSGWRSGRTRTLAS